MTETDGGMMKCTCYESDDGVLTQIYDPSGNAMTMGEIVRRLNAEVPQWHSRPTGPGLWLTICSRPRAYTFVALQLDAEDLARGAPFETDAVYGPIPERTTRAAGAAGSVK